MYHIFTKIKLSSQYLGATHLRLVAAPAPDDPQVGDIVGLYDGQHLVPTTTAPGGGSTAVVVAENE